MKIYKDELYFSFFIFYTIDLRSKDSKVGAKWSSMLSIESFLPRLKKISRPGSTQFRLLTKSRSIARSDISRGAVGKVDIERHGGGRWWRAGVACVARVSNAQVS